MTPEQDVYLISRTFGNAYKEHLTSRKYHFETPSLKVNCFYMYSHR